ncbi:CidA/LrgA family protein [Treponema sp.]|uniref:CidA/LrgA family protein n=1 Tax=Treponema sp. TaxID=166 RepID=UPI003F0D8915
MKYVLQFALIISISFAGEILNRIIPLPVPASIYGLVILFFCLELKIVKLHQVKEAGRFLLSVMPVMFVPSSVGFMNAFPVMRRYGVCFVIIAVVTTFSVMVVTGHAVQFIIRLRRNAECRRKKQ